MSIDRMRGPRRAVRAGTGAYAGGLREISGRHPFLLAMDDQRTEPGSVPGAQPGPVAGQDQTTPTLPVYAGLEPAPPPRLDIPAPASSSNAAANATAPRPRRARGVGTLLAVSLLSATL